MTMKMKTMILGLAVAAGIGLPGAREAAASHRSFLPDPHVSIQFGGGRGHYGGYGGGYYGGYRAPRYSSYGPARNGYTDYRPDRLVRVFVPFPYPHFELRREYRRSPYRRYGY
jgi:hypothetical protein